MRASRDASWRGDRMTDMETEAKLWKRLKVGDRVRLVHVPTEFSRPGYLIHRDTLRAYRRVIERRRSQRNFEIDAAGVPWISFRFKMKNGRWEHHRLAVNHDGLVLVRARAVGRGTSE
jgi:hypothetical protein